MFGPWVTAAILLASGVGIAADPPIVPFTVCEVLRDLPAREGKNVAVMGRYSSRGNDRWVSEDGCTPPIEGTPQLWLAEDPKSGPKPPSNFELDAPTLDRKFAEIRRHSTLGKFRFGSPDFDRWAVVYGRVETRKGDDGRKFPANLAFRGSGVVVFLTNE